MIIINGFIINQSSELTVQIQNVQKYWCQILDSNQNVPNTKRELQHFIELSKRYLFLLEASFELMLHRISSNLDIIDHQASLIMKEVTKIFGKINVLYSKTFNAETSAIRLLKMFILMTTIK